MLRTWHAAINGHAQLDHLHGYTSRHTDEAMSSRSSEEEINDEEAVARAGDSGPLHNLEDADPWSTGEIDHLKAKWLQKEFKEYAARDKELRSFSGRASQEENEITILASLPHIRSSRSSRRSSASDHVIEFGLDVLKREPEKANVKDLALSPLSDTPLASEFTSIGPSDDQISSQYLPKAASQVLIRYGLEVLFENVLSVTHEGTIQYKDLPANVVGSFFMGWVGIVWKKDILMLSEAMAIGLSTGLMGSITTYAGWNQKMVALLTTGDVGAALSGLLLGMVIAQTLLLAGIDSATGLKLTMTAKRRRNQITDDLEDVGKQPRVNLYGGIVSSAVITFATSCLWGAALALLIRGQSSQKLDILWLGCLVAPPGVWARWHLARFNGKGIGTRLKWLPVGTLMANLIAASLEAVLSLLEFVATSKNAPLVIGGLQLGFLGCLSTVSTFVAEVYTMHVGPMRLKAYTYTVLTLGMGLALSALLYTAPALAKGYVKW